MKVLNGFCDLFDVFDGFFLTEFLVNFQLIVKISAFSILQEKV